jgi:iron(III) transport system permease protein
MRNRAGGIGWVFAVAATGLLFVVLSLLGTVLGSVGDTATMGSFTLKNYWQLALAPDLVEVLLNTVMLGLGSIAVMLVFSLPICWLLARTDFPWKGTMMTLLTAKLAVPGFITAMAYVWLFNPNSGIANKMFGATGIGATPVFDVYSLTWICFLQGLVLTPACVFMMLPAFLNMGSILEEAAWVNGVSRLRAYRRIIVPLLAPGVLAATLFFFVVAVEIFDFVGPIGMPARLGVLSVWIYDALHPTAGVPDYGFAAAAGMLLFVVAGFAIAFYIRCLRQAQRYAVVTGKGQAFTPVPLGRWRWAALAFVGAWVVLAFLIPVAALVWVATVPFLQPPSAQALASVNLVSFRHALSYLGAPLQNTLVVMAGSVVLAVAWSTCISWVVTRSRSRLARWVDAIVFLSLAVPSMVAAVAFQYAGMALHQWLPLYGTVWLIAIAMATRMLAFCTRTINGPALQIHVELDEAAYVSGVSRMRSFRRVFLPIIAPAMLYSGVMVAMLAARDLTLPLMMNTGKSPLVSTLIYDLQTGGDFNVAAAIGLYMIAMLLLLVAVAHAIARLGTTGRRPGRGALAGRLLRRGVAARPA